LQACAKVGWLPVCKAISLIEREAFLSPVSLMKAFGSFVDSFYSSFCFSTSNADMIHRLPYVFNEQWLISKKDSFLLFAIYFQIVPS